MPYYNLDNMTEEEKYPGFRGRFIHTPSMTFAYWSIRGGAALPEHDHPHEQVLTMLDGQFELILDGERRVLGPGDVVVIPPHARHGGAAVTDCRILDVFHPVREDYR